METKEITKAITEEKNLISPVKRVESVAGLITPVRRMTPEEAMLLENVKLELSLPDLPGNTVSLEDEAKFYTMKGAMPDFPISSKNSGIKFEDVLRGYRKIEAHPDCVWVSDFLRDEQWYPGEYVFLESSCSTGKNTFLEELVRSQKYGKVLILCNRSANQKQIMSRLGLDTVKKNKLKELERTGKISVNLAGSKVDVMTYQSLELQSKCWSRELEGYGVLCLDESHYWVQDSQFNARAAISLEKVLGTVNPIKLFMSATEEEIRDYILQTLRNRYKSFVLPVRVSHYQMIRNYQNITGISYVAFNDIVNLAKATPDDKWLIFVDNKEQGRNFVEALGKEQAVFISSESSKADNDAKKEYENIVCHESFAHRIVVTTAVLDNGINIKDSMVRHVAICSNNRIEMIQMLGRKRCFAHYDTFHLYIMHYSPSEISRLLYMNKMEQSTWVNIRENVGRDFPPVEISLNSKEGEQCREVLYLHELRKECCFNELGFLGLKIAEKDLLELSNSSDPFFTKLKWLFPKGLPTYNVIGKEEFYKDRITKIMEAIEPYLNLRVQVKSDEMKGFRETFTKTFFELFGTEEDQRKDRLLSLNAIMHASRKYEIPITLQSCQMDRKTYYYIKATGSYVVESDNQ